MFLHTLRSGSACDDSRSEQRMDLTKVDKGMCGKTQDSSGIRQALDDLLHQAVSCVFISIGIIHLWLSFLVPSEGAI